eukprot:GFUD01000475.1.p1 GENE.GFUD01000475.1~~GFUD01000475.1.p1  ORF type:complete len:711 (+),score=242.69 GFUD01000475.1:105-2237(+)
MTFSTQRLDPGIAKAEERLGEILTCLGKNRIPELEVGDFYEDLVNEPRSQGRLEAFEEQIGVRLGLRILDQVMLEQFTKIEDLKIVENDLKAQLEKASKEKRRIEEENKSTKSELSSLRKQFLAVTNDSQTTKSEQKNCLSEVSSLKKENQNLKSKLSSLVKQYDQVISELRYDNPPAPSTDLPKTSTRKRKSPTPEIEVDNTPVRKSNSRIFSRKLSPNEALLHSNSTQAHMDDISFVPETLSVYESPSISKPLPVMKVSVPDTPEKGKTSHNLVTSKVYHQSVTPEKVKFQNSEHQVEPKQVKPPSSPVIARSLSRGGKKMRLVMREKGEGVNNPLAVPEKDRQEYKNSLKVCTFEEETDNVKKVGKVAPSVQIEIDKKSFHDLDTDFPTPKISKKGSEKVRKIVPHTIPSDTDSDFESPNLLIKRNSRRAALISEKSKGGPEFKTPKVAEIKTTTPRTENEDIEIFPSPDDKPVVEPKNGLKKSKSTKLPPQKAENRWGMEVDEITGSQKKRLKNQKQAKIDGFFKNPPPRQNSDFKRINHADTDMERALKLSKEVEEGQQIKDSEKEKSSRSPSPDLEEEVQEVDQNQPEFAQFAYVKTGGRSKEERRQLYGFDCRECEEYYHMKLEEGLTKDQIMKVLNKCSRHRGFFKPPLTPEKFWDADIVEGDPNSPRNKTQAGEPFRNRAKRRAEARDKRKALKNLDNNEI